MSNCHSCIVCIAFQGCNQTEKNVSDTLTKIFVWMFWLIKAPVLFRGNSYPLLIHMRNLKESLLDIGSVIFCEHVLPSTNWYLAVLYCFYCPLLFPTCWSKINIFSHIHLIYLQNILHLFIFCWLYPRFEVISEIRII